MTREQHGMDRTPEHHSWVSMRQRCNNPKRRDYPHYGGRGIKVCQRWQASFSAFYADVGPRPTPSHSLDRIDVNGNYEPGNVRWATQKEQIENTRVVRMVTIGGKTQSVSAWEREMGLAKGQVRSREANGWNIEQAILTPSVKAQKVRKYVPQGYSRLKNGTFRVKLDGVYIKTVSSEADAIALVAMHRNGQSLAATSSGDSR